MESELSSLCFPEKLWRIMESDQFRSIWWSESRKCVAINEELFKEEVLGRAGPLRVFSMRKMKSFLRQLNYCGFTKMPQDHQRSASLPEFLAEEAAASAHSQILHYYNPSFNRDHPHLLEQRKRRGGRKRRAPEAPEVDERHPASSPDGQPAGDTPASPPALTVPTKRRAESPPSLGSARPSPEAAAPTPPEPAGAAGSAGLTPLGIFLLLSTSSQTPGGLQGAAPAPPLIAVPVLGVAAALEKPPQSQSPAVPHCPTCTCSPSPAAIVPQHDTS
ncbi:heat shock transcription factor, X-linked-like isoform X1 [Athene noctua]|uniref:heat shock transcription factor, X-linked-like isoform X1 n=2 Tax=Athene noctua TaxID=126797 RepID=UPI003EC05FD6